MFTILLALWTLVTGSLFEGAPPAGGEGGEGAGAGGGGEPPKPDPKSEPPKPPEGDGNVVPKARFDEVLNERNALQREKQEREADEAKRRGDWQKAHDTEKEKRETAEARAERIGRRAAFVGGASGKVADVEAAYKLAAADGLLDAVEIDDDGNAKDPKAVETIVASLTKKYEFLKPGTGRGFGGDHGDGGQAPESTEGMSGLELMRAGIQRGEGRLTKRT